VTRRCDERGLTGLQELAIAIGIAALLSVGGLFTYNVLTNGADDKTAQSSVSSVLTAANDVYQDTQDYGLIGSSTPNANGTGACGTTTAPFKTMRSYATNETLQCGPITTAGPIVVVVSSGELVDGDAGGWIGLAARSKDGICWQAYQPADGPAIYGSVTSTSCNAPQSAPSGGGTSW
jgi:hypothetical protein